MSTYTRPQLPLPSPDAAAYAAELEACLALSEAKRDNHALYQTRTRRAGLDYHPVKMDFENVSRCNFRCPKCQVSGWEGGLRARDMLLDEFAGLLEGMPGLVEMKLQGMGEPLLGGETFFAMIRAARERRIWVRTTTNASLLGRDDNHIRLVDADPNEIQISVDGATPEVQELVRKGSRFELVAANCRLVNAYCNARGLLKTRMWTCLQQQNAHQFLDMVETAANLGFRRLTYALNLHGWGQDVYQERNTALALDENAVADLAGQALERGARLGVQVSFWSNVSKYSTTSPATLCPWPFERAFISSDMRVAPCCMIANPDVLSLGNAQAFQDVWFGRTYQAFRQAHLDGRPPRACRNCYAMTDSGGGEP